ncbi:tetratricopeptide repeat protein [Sulfobacillus thermosulfidooxidans]|uniref:Uncharacterized protein n=1 Tax=Sulfobacillus thermosulfidooxidans TaxID=28034 RepID=A0A2T2WVX4_SULTH|nr:hypothetical protein [Sulfobacillus thermosulfidooxidans]PSR26388.1 MAG: hypothetical protein C7B47_10860 [Sulfobacillus thermosulfidooxidans]
MKKWHVITVAMASLGVIAAGCGQSQANSQPKTPATTSAAPQSSTTRVFRIGTKPYQGKKNLEKFEAEAKAHPHSYQAQIAAGTAANVNNQPSTAIAYWEKAIKLDPHKGNPYEYIGNIYLEVYNNPKEALVWYKKAITYGPSYDYGWYRVVQLEVQFGNMQAAKKYAAEAAKVLPANDKVLQALETFVTPKS